MCDFDRSAIDDYTGRITSSKSLNYKATGIVSRTGRCRSVTDNQLQLAVVQGSEQLRIEATESGSYYYHRSGHLGFDCLEDLYGVRCGLATARVKAKWFES